MKLYVNLGPIDEHDAIDELKKEQNMKPNMPDRGKALEAAPEKDLPGVSVDPVPSTRVEDVVEAPMSEPVPQVTQAQEPTTALAEETAAEPVLDTVDTVQDVPAAEEAKDEETPVKKSKAKKSKAK